MKNVLLLILIISLFGCATSKTQNAELDDSMAIAKDFLKKLDEDRLRYESDIYWHFSQPVKIRVYQNVLAISWPGDNSQTIEIIDKEGNKLNSKVVGGEPVMIKAWSTYFNSAIYIYIECIHRRSFKKGVYIYEIDKDLNIKERGIYFSKEEVDKEKECPSLMLGG